MQPSPISKRQRRVDLFLVVAAIVFGPFTQLRIGFFGVPEVVMMVFVLRILSRKGLRLNFWANDWFIFTKFWLVFLLLSMIGFAYNTVILNLASSTLSSMMFDGMAYLLVAVICFCLELFVYNYRDVDLWIVLEKVYYLSSVSMLVLYVSSFFTSSIFGFGLMYWDHFRPLATNIHHVSMSIAPLPFLGVKMLFEKRSVVQKSVLAGLVVSNVITGMSTGSTKITLSFIAGLVALLVFLVPSKIANRKFRVVYAVFFMLILLVVASFCAEQIATYAVEFFRTEDLGSGREVLYTSSVHKILRSPIVGYGPGAHGEYWQGRYSDAHQSFLTVALQGGLLALVAYIYLQYAIFKKCSIVPFILSAYTGLLVYALGGDIVRRLPMWMFLVLSYHYCLQGPALHVERNT